MVEYVCGECGERNPVGSEFCAYCHAYLAWDEVQSGGGGGPASAQAPTSTVGTGGSNPSTRSRAGDSEPLTEQESMSTIIRVPVTGEHQVAAGRGLPGGPAGVAAARGPGRESTTSTRPEPERFRAVLEQPGAQVPATGEPVSLQLEVTNTSMIVDGYAVDAPGAPDWLLVESGDVQLLPGTEGVLPVQLRISSPSLVPAQRFQQVLRIRSLSQAPAHVDVSVDVTVPVIDAPVRLRAEPRLLRTRDQAEAEFSVVVDNAASNRPVQLRLAGSDPELAVRFRFEPQLLQVGPSGSGSVRVLTAADLPEPGQESSRSLTIAAAEGSRSVETVVTWVQASSVRVEDPPVRLEAEPSLVRVRDSAVGVVRILADNRSGKEWAHLQLRASDPERIVRVSWASPQLHVPPGGTAQAEARLEAPLPEAVAEVSRTVTITASDGRRTSSTTATFLQLASESPMTTLGIRMEPSVVRVLDADNAAAQVVLDNRRGRAGVRVFLHGSDPERAVRFTFTPATVDLRPGEVRPVALRLDSWRPQPGQEHTRELTITATDGSTTVDARGSLVQTASRAAIELLRLRLDPSVLRLSNRSRGPVRAVVDNRSGAQPVRVSLRGDDPENIVRFAFAPPTLEVPAGQMGAANVTVSAPRPPGGREVSRPFVIMATDGRFETQAEGTLVQSSAARRPLARVLFTLLGGLTMIIGAFRPWIARTEITGMDITAERVAGVFNTQLNMLGFDRVISAGLVVIVLAVLAMFGLTGRSGRLTRLMALLGVLFVVALFVTFAFFPSLSSVPASGVFVVILGCVAAYIGGLLRPR